MLIEITVFGYVVNFYVRLSSICDEGSNIDFNCGIGLNKVGSYLPEYGDQTIDESNEEVE